MNATEQSRYDSISRDNDRLRLKVAYVEHTNEDLLNAVASGDARMLRVAHENSALVEQICILRRQLEVSNGLQIINP